MDSAYRYKYNVIIFPILQKMDEEFDRMFAKLLAQATIIEEQWRRRPNMSNEPMEQRSERKNGVNKDDNLGENAKLEETGLVDSGYDSDFDCSNVKQ